MKEKILKIVSIVTVICLLACMFIPNSVKSVQTVVVKMTNTGLGIGNTKVFTATVKGYNNIFCVNGGAHLNDGTVLDDNGISLYNASAVSSITSKPKALSYVLDNIYVPEGADETTKNEMKNNLKKIIKTYANSSNGKTVLANKVGVSGIDDNWINTAVNALLNDGTTLFAVQQYSVWHYVKNNNAAYNNAMQNSDGSYNVIPGAKTDKKYYQTLYASLTGLADQAQNNGYVSPNVDGNTNIKLDKAGDVKVTLQDDKKSALIGPYKLTNNTSVFGKSFSGTVNSENVDKIETVDADGKNLNVNSKKDNFYVKVTYNKGFNKGVKYNFKINVKVSGCKTFAKLLTPADKVSQPLTSISKEAFTINSSMEASYYEELKGNYSLRLEKVDSKNSNTKIEGVTFKVKEGSGEAKSYGPTDSNGLVTIFENKAITKEGVAEYTITEVNVGDNEYISLKDEVKFYITLSKTKDAYVASKVSFEKEGDITKKEVTLQDNSKVTVTANLDKSKNAITITIPNKPDLKGKYSLILQKVSTINSNIPVSGVTFKVKEGSGEAKSYGPTGQNGTINVFKDREIKENDKGVKEFTLTEVNVGDNEYIKLQDTVKFYITISEQDGVLIASKVSFKKDEDSYKKEVTLEDNSKTTVTASIRGSKVLIQVPNKPVPNGEFSLDLEKIDSTDANKKISGVTFKVKEGTGEEKTYGPTDEKGVINIVNERKVKKAGLYEYTITEVNVGDKEYIKLNDSFRIYIKMEEQGNQLVATKVSFNRNAEITSQEVALQDGSKVTVTAVIKDGKATITIPNKPEPKGRYSLQLEKVDSEDTNKKISGVTFKVKEGTGEEKTYGPTDEKGVVNIVNEREVKKEETYEYAITEVDVGDNKYLKTTDIIKTYIKISKVENAYVISQVSFDKDKVEAEKEVELEDGTKATIKAKISGETVTITIPNKKAIFDLALRKYITKINGSEIENSREPVIRLKDASAILKEGTAMYNNPKDPVKVKGGDKVTYTIRIYNEGNINGFAKEITDYLPNGLEFVEDSEINKQNKWVATKNEDGVTIVKTKVLEDTEIPASNGAIGYQDLATKNNNPGENFVKFWKDVEIECKVKENVGKEQKLHNVAEITNYGYMNGNDYIQAKENGVDRDSEQDNVFGENKNQKAIEDYYQTQYIDKNEKEKQDNGNTETKNNEKINNYPGRQDDDDFENLIVEPDLKQFKFVLNKVDENGNPLIGADFTVKREKDGTNETLLDNSEVNGTFEVLEEKVQVNKTYTYRVVEVESAPEYVNVMDGKYITLRVYINEQKELVLGNYEKIEEEDYLINKYGFIINNTDGTIVKENETDLYEKIVVKVNNQVSPSKVEIAIPNYLKPKDFDLALRKFITEIRKDVESKDEQKQVITNRIPQFKVDEKGNYKYEHTKEPIIVINNNVVVYTLRVYNEGEVDGYAKEIKDNIPNGLEFLPEYNLNKEYRWKMLDKYGKETIEVKNAVSIVTDYLSKEQEEASGENLIRAFNLEEYKTGKIKEPYYREVKVAFKVNTDPKSEEILINEAQISDDSDSNGNDVTDKDSTPNKWIDGEDDQDIEKVKVLYFDLSLRKWVTKAIVIEDGNETIIETGHDAEDDPEEIVKVDLQQSKIEDITVKFEYSIRVKNEGKIAGYAKEIADYIPEGLKFVKEDNPDWDEIDGVITTSRLENVLLEPGDMAEVSIILTWINREDNMGLKVNVAEISKDKNEYDAPDIDSTPGNKVPGEDDIDDAPVMLTIKTGQNATYIGIIAIVLVIIAGSIIVIKKVVLK